MKSRGAVWGVPAAAPFVFGAAAGPPGQSKPAGSASSTTPSPSTSSSPTPFVKGTRMRIPGKLSIVVPDGYIAYTAEQTRQRSYPIVIVPQGTPVEKADRTPQRLDVFMYISNKNAEKNRDRFCEDHKGWPQIKNMKKEKSVKINNVTFHGVSYKKTDSGGWVSRQSWYGATKNEAWAIDIIGPDNAENIPQELLDAMRTIEFAKQKQTDSD